MFYEPLIKIAKEENCFVIEDQPLAKYTSFKIGGKADLMINVFGEMALIKILKFICSEKIPYYILGNGSNLLINDNGFRGVILKLSGEFTDIKLLNNDVILCGAGAKISKLCLFTLENYLSGLEFLWGIPASLGGAVFMNAGAYNLEIKDVFLSCSHITPCGRVEELKKEGLEFGYRKSVYMKSKNIITFVKLQLQKANKLAIKSKMDDFLQKRKEKQPLNYPNAGSIFKRPIGNFAGTLISNCGLKGLRIGGAQVSEKHAGFIVNTGVATCEDVLNLIKLVQEEVFKKSGVLLEKELMVL
ncbi:MAG: UDP-N-acetylmuramate dehydrogenase [Oscillospiraceae bacterium]|jgi:UDP-N-acetylmuramate dehydrogenase|nr:UDP-N-acetylmuramate dehydrogenase [Oscillospiraceae bacterium]